MPTVEQVYQGNQLSPPPVAYILASFNTHPPMQLDYLMSVRAYGDLKALIDDKPSWGRSLIERSLILTYNDQSDMDQVIAVLRADDAIENATINSELELAVNASATDQSPDRGSIQQDWHQQAINWFQAPNVDSAYGHLAYIDVGAPSNRTEFEPFDVNTGTFNGGGLNLSQSYATVYGDRNIYDLWQLEAAQVSNGATCDLSDAMPNDGLLFPSVRFAGHGNHVAGLMIAQGDN